MERNSFVFYRGIKECIDSLPKANQLPCYKAILEYALDGKMPQKGTIEYSILLAFKPQIDTNNQRYQNGKKGGRPKTETKPNENQNITKYEPNDNDNVNDNVNKKENIKEKRNEDISSVVSYLNDRASTHYRSSSRNTRSHINARFEDGFTLEDFKQVIDTKCDEWLGTDMAKYLRPDTLFGTKFESYLNQKPRAKPQAPNYSIDNSNLGITEEDIERYLK